MNASDSVKKSDRSGAIHAEFHVMICIPWLVILHSRVSNVDVTSYFKPNFITLKAASWDDIDLCF